MQSERSPQEEYIYYLEGSKDPHATRRERRVARKILRQIQRRGGVGPKMRRFFDGALVTPDGQRYRPCP